VAAILAPLHHREPSVNPEHHDKTFVVTFLLVLGFLGAFTITIWTIAHAIGTPDEPDPEAAGRIEERIKPLGQVATDASQLLAAAPAATARAPMSAEEIVTRVCSACHGTGVLNAPKIGDKAEWSKRKAAGMSTLMASSLNGKNQMPARGGDPSLTDAEVKAAVEQMLKQSGV
jgi:cytochrome c5